MISSFENFALPPPLRKTFGSATELLYYIIICERIKCFRIEKKAILGQSSYDYCYNTTTIQFAVYILVNLDKY